MGLWKEAAMRRKTPPTQDTPLQEEMPFWLWSRTLRAPLSHMARAKVQRRAQENKSKPRS